MSLAEAIAHPDYRTEVLPAVQQAYGDAVAAEAPVFAITNYEVTVFCHRNLTDVTDKRIWACPPISWNEVSLPPRAAWLHFMAVAQSCQDLRSKDRLLRGQVPVTPLSGYSLRLTSEELSLRLKAGARRGHRREGMQQQPARRAKAHAAKSAGTHASSLEMQASSALLGDGNTGYLSATDSIGPVHLHCDLSAAACCTQDHLAIWLQRLPAGPLADVTSELCWISYPTLTMECLASTAVVRVMKIVH
ncbi:TPA: hypothetical protein ACH3X2_002399 [Trebouxia sp. C0005]